MAANSSSGGQQLTTVEAASAEEVAANVLQKRYEGLVMVRTKAIKGKGAWYWAHLEPMLVHNTDTGFPKAVKLRCSLCDAVFSASNPSRTASEHLKRGTCPNFNSLAKPISSISPPLASPSSHHHHHHHHQQQQHNRHQQPPHGNRKRPSSSSPISVATAATVAVTVAPPTPSTGSYQVSPITVVDPSRFCTGDFRYSTMTVASGGATGGLLTQQPHLMLSGGKDDLGPLAMLEDSVKKLKSPKTSPGPTLSKTQMSSALDYLADWVYDSYGSVSISSLEHPKFKSFLNQIGFPLISRREFSGNRLDAKFEESKTESEARIREAMFFQIAADGWKMKNPNNNEENLVHVTVNLPNGTSLYRRAVFVKGLIPSNYAEEILSETITGISGSQQCVGIVADKFKSTALRNLETQHHWMVNLSCQFQGFNSLIKDLNKELILFRNVTENCLKLASFINNTTQIRNTFRKYQLQEYGHADMLTMPLFRNSNSNSNSESTFTLLDDILNNARALHLVLLDEAYKIVSMEDHTAREIADMIRDVGFWNELEAVHSLVKLIKDMAKEIEIERPLVAQCLPLWDELRSKVKEWCSKYQIVEETVETVIEKRFRKNYHPAWAAAFILDPLYLIRDISGKYLPPFKCLTTEQEKDVDKLITRLVSREEAHIALMELMKWRTEGLDPLYAQAVQMKERDPISGKMRIVNPQSSRLVWETYLTEFKSLGKVAVRLIFLHATSCGIKPSWSLQKWVTHGHAHGRARAHAHAHGHSRVGMEKAEKLIFIAAHSKLERRDFLTDEEKDLELFGLANGEDDVLNDDLVDK